jgi:phosphoesterase RecJ-like protein
VDNQEIEQLKALISIQRKVVVLAHTNPDGDALGSALAFAQFLTSKGHSVNVIVPNAFPGFLAWMSGASSIMVWETDPAECKRIIGESDLAFCMDFNALHRLDKMGEMVGTARAVKVLIDHHISPSDEFDLMFSQTAVSSTSELVFQIIDALGDADAIDKDMATNLFVGMMTDTGSFSYACGHPQTFRIAADLIARGVDPEWVHRQVYDTYSEDRMRLLGFSLGERMKVLPEFHTAYIYLTQDDLKRFRHRNGDTEGLVNYPLSISGITLSVLFTEKKDHVRMSLRSKGEFSVNTLVREHFDGGGHRNAAGGNSYLSLEDTLARFEALLPLYKEALSKNGNG